MANMSILEEYSTFLRTAGGYTVLIAIGYVIYSVSTRKDKKRTAVPTKITQSVTPEQRRKDNKKKQRLESFVSDDVKTAKKNAREKLAEVSPWTAATALSPDNSDDGVDNREFAKQLAKAKEGTKFAANAEKNKQREKSVKQSRANKMAGNKTEVKAASESSTTGADADDDQSSVASPERTAADASGVADMLEPAPSGPSILRLTDTQPKKQQQRVAKAPEVVESKKQRQNRKKAEANKAAREEDEKVRKTLEEKQRRAARIADGRPAKDGSQFLASNGNGKSSWSKGAPNGQKGGATNGDAALHEPLDTFEATKPEPKAAPKKAAVEKSDEAWMSSLPSEEEQLKMLNVDADDWSTVKTKTKKSKKVDSGDEAPVQKPAAPAATVETKSRPSAAAPSKSFGSYSALTTEEPADDDEEEWEV